jgi:flavorubredoxin
MKTEDSMTNREIDLEQALIAVIGAYRKTGGDVETLVKDAQGLIIGHSEYRITDHPHVTQACTEIEKAAAFKK